MDINLKMKNALNNSDIVNIMHEATKTFNKHLDKETIHSCKLYAMWRCLINFNPERGNKFTTYLYNAVKFECLKQLKKDKKHIKNRKMLHNNIADKSSSDTLAIDIFDEIKTEEEKEMLYSKMNYESYAEMAEKQGVTRETARKRYKKLTESFKDKFM